MEHLDENALIDLARGGAARDLVARAEQHLAGCDDCARAIAAVAQVVTASGLLPVDLPAGHPRDGLPPAGVPPAGDPSGLPVSATARTTAQETHRIGPAPLLAVGAVLKERYVISRLISAGGMGEVYEAAHTRLAGRYAVKVLSLDFTEASAMLTRFKREAEITSALRHPNIVQVFDFDYTPEGRPFLAMEFIEGRHLGEVIQAESPMSLARVIDLIAPVVSALAAIHRQQVVHRDLKPQNIMLSPSPEGGHEVVKLLDFGLSKRWGSASSESLRVSRERTLLGTPMYMAPEQARGNPDDVGPATDQFALGAIVYEMLTRQPPFAADSIHAVLHHIIYEDPRPLRTLAPNLPASVEQALDRALAKDPAQRFPSIRDLLDALRDSAFSIAPAAAPGSVAAAAASRPTRRAWAMAAGALLASSGALAGWIHWRGAASAPRLPGEDDRHHPSPTVTVVRARAPAGSPTSHADAAATSAGGTASASASAGAAVTGGLESGKPAPVDQPRGAAATPTRRLASKNRPPRSLAPPPPPPPAPGDVPPVAPPPEKKPRIHLYPD
ncbi:MAG TPA: serine/threonine-protein kinase [Polyangia bacterium]|nr:serine/threonine-protein kinase [Polyangia bacterium]